MRILTTARPDLVSDFCTMEQPPPAWPAKRTTYSAAVNPLSF